VRTCEANELKVEELDNEKTLILVLATAGQGEDCANAKKFTSALLARKSKLPSSLRVAVFGLGDSHYWGKVRCSLQLQLKVLQTTKLGLG